MAIPPVLLPENSRGQRSLAGYCPRGHKELDMTEHTHTHTHTHTYLSPKGLQKQKSFYHLLEYFNFAFLPTFWTYGTVARID